MKGRSFLLKWAPVLLTVLAIAALGVVEGRAGDTGGASGKPAARTTGMPAESEYLIISPHTADQCLAALDAFTAQPNGAMELERWEFGCMSGDHTGYRMTYAASEDEALKMVPASLRAKARVIKLNRFTPEQLRAMHQMK